ncbi:MAG: biotin attachment protein [Desulfovibrio sp.]|nr:biotin attachment protein [Desulfovibrio sp.]MBI4960025.1 biotin attachment protein [Desulfovibrio sp.]
MQDVKAILEEIKASPYEEVEVIAPHTGVVEFKVTEEGTKVQAPSGTWKEKPGTLLVTLGRERNAKPIHCSRKGEVQKIHAHLNGKFVEAGTPLMVLRHFFTKDEVTQLILKKVLFLFPAPERAKYYFVPETDKKVKVTGCQSIKVKDGMDLFIVSRMKREKPLSYVGPEGIIYATYFSHDQNVDAGQPLISVCPEAQMGVIRDVVNRVQSDWEERD